MYTPAREENLGPTKIKNKTCALPLRRFCFLVCDTGGLLKSVSPPIILSANNPFQPYYYPVAGTSRHKGHPTTGCSTTCYHWFYNSG